MSKTKIEWTDNSDNIFVVETEDGKHGWHCEKISAGCKFCYAETLNERKFHGYGTGKSYQRKNRPDKYIFREDILDKWTRMRAPKIHFINSMTDTFLDLYNNMHLTILFRLMREAENQFFIILTKHPERALELERLGIIEWADNIMFMVTVEDQENANLRIPLLLQSSARNKGLSIEPLLGNIEIYKALPTGYFTIISHGLDEKAILGLKKIFNEYRNTNKSKPVTLADGSSIEWEKKKNFVDWIIVGGESGSKARPMHPEWVKSLRDQCKNAGTALFFKQWGEYIHHSQILSLNPEVIIKKWDEKKNHDGYFKLGKKKAGALLDGEEVREYPECIIKHFEKYGSKKVSTKSY